MSSFPKNSVSVTRGWVGVQFPGKKRFVTLEWPLTTNLRMEQIIVLYSVKKLVLLYFDFFYSNSQLLVLHSFNLHT